MSRHPVNGKLIRIRTKSGRTVVATPSHSFVVRGPDGKPISAFDQLLMSGENNSLTDNCQYWKGECYYGLGNYGQAIMEFQKVFAFPNSNKYDDAQLKLGLCYMQMNNYDQAKMEFDKLLKEYPSSEYANRARSFLNQL